MSRRQRLVFLAIAVVIAVAAVALLGGGEDTGPSSTTTAAGTATAAPSATAEPEEASPVETATDEPEAVLLTAGRERTIEVTQGDRVEFRVRSDAPEEVHVHGYDVVKELEPGRTETISFTADLTGIWEIELEVSHQPIGRLRVVPE